MKTTKLFILSIILFGFTGCATVFGGKVTEYQRTKPGPDEPARKMRMAPFILDILFYPVIALPVDFLTHAIYKPSPPETVGKTVSK